ncbi:hypothetical protein [Streptomyces sp. NRRL S-31]|nr:hypothetical protein [Streptomyces sp. NRRL S-31]
MFRYGRVDVLGPKPHEAVLTGRRRTARRPRRRTFAPVAAQRSPVTEVQC